jgi:hypothetical protein
MRMRRFFSAHEAFLVISLPLDLHASSYCRRHWRSEAVATEAVLRRVALPLLALRKQLLVSGGTGGDFFLGGEFS